MIYCKSCAQLEGNTTWDDETEEQLCVDCGEPVEDVPEHDDNDMER